MHLIVINIWVSITESEANNRLLLQDYDNIWVVQKNSQNELSY